MLSLYLQAKILFLLIVSRLYCHCISWFGFVNKLLLPCVADEWHSVCEKLFLLKRNISKSRHQVHSILLISHRFLQGKVIYGVTVTLFGSTVFMALFQYTGHWGISANAIFMFLAGACNCGVDPYLTGSIPAEIGEHENAQAATSGLVNGKQIIFHV